jgi:hypothetical protein
MSLVVVFQDNVAITRVNDSGMVLNCIINVIFLIQTHVAHPLSNSFLIPALNLSCAFVIATLLAPILFHFTVKYQRNLERYSRLDSVADIATGYGFDD